MQNTCNSTSCYIVVSPCKHRCRRGQQFVHVVAKVHLAKHPNNTSKTPPTGCTPVSAGVHGRVAGDAHSRCHHANTRVCRGVYFSVSRWLSTPELTPPKHPQHGCKPVCTGGTCVQQGCARTPADTCLEVFTEVVNLVCKSVHPGVYSDPPKHLLTPPDTVCTGGACVQHTYAQTPADTCFEVFAEVAMLGRDTNPDDVYQPVINTRWMCAHGRTAGHTCTHSVSTCASWDVHTILPSSTQTSENTSDG